MAAKLLPTTVVGSYPQPDWLIDRDNLRGRLPARVRAREMWRVAPEFLEQAQNDATLVAIRDMERAGIDIITDGEIRRESYSNRLATALGGIDQEKAGSALDRTGHANPVPRVMGPITRLRPVEVEDVRFLRANTDRTIKITLPGPFTMTQQAQDDYYKDDEALAMAYADAVNAEARDLKAAGADVIQIDEPYLQARHEKAKQYGVKAINRALAGIPGPTALHICFGYAHVVHARASAYSFLPQLADSIVEQISIEAAQPDLDLGVLKDLSNKTMIMGVISLGDPQVETADQVAERIRRILGALPPERVIPAPDCGMKYIPRATAFGKLKALAAGAAIVRKELAG
ncbi:MAG: 5-methyltetrahydropteroyltriglutamate--homocysteine methyltransferase [Alphaproteobacteria bacterium]|nr:5-methyltetrahydropteroyltriglutamate--homocysteine methyltransferase [Alphaproteobacteria bacterium]